MENYPSSEGRLSLHLRLSQSYTRCKQLDAWNVHFLLFPVATLCTNKHFLSPIKNRKKIFLLELNSKRRLVVLDVGFENGGISLGFLYSVVRLD